MFDYNFTKNFQEGEELLSIVRRHTITMIAPILLWSVILLLDFFFMVVLIQRGWWGAMIFIVVILGVALLIWRTVYLWSMNAFILTNRRLMDYDQKGLFHRVVSVTPYAKIQDVSYRLKGIWQSIFRVGTIFLQTAGTQTNLEIYNVGQPEKAVDLIHGAMKDSKPNDDPPPMATQEFVSLLKKMRESLGDQAVDELIKRSTKEDNLEDEIL
jgi:membrane protein YdbS with pleckstrin-like domain